MPILKWVAIFQKVANHAVLIYPSRLDPYCSAHTSYSPFPDKADRAMNPAKYAQDREVTRLAFPESYMDRNSEERHAGSLVDTQTALCGKWSVLKGLLARWKEKGDKVLLFSRSTRLLDALQFWLDKGRVNSQSWILTNVTSESYDMVRLDGSVQPEKREFSCTGCVKCS